MTKNVKITKTLVCPAFAVRTTEPFLYGEMWPAKANFACVHRKRLSSGKWTKRAVEFFEDEKKALDCYANLLAIGRQWENDFELERYVNSLGPLHSLVNIDHGLIVLH